jgi:hypothetical protein
MKLCAHLIHRIYALLAFITLAITTCFGTPLNNVFDTQPIYTPLGVDKYYKEKHKGEVRWYISPIYQHASSVRNGCGKKAKAGDRLGKWNIFGAFFGQDARPVGTEIPTNYSNIYAAQLEASEVTKQDQGDSSATYSRYRGGTPEDDPSIDLTLEQNFDPNTRTWAYVAIPACYEKIGVRSQFNFDFGFGLGVSVKGGVVDTKFKPKRTILEKQFRTDIAAVPTTEDSLTNEQKDAKELYAEVFSNNRLKGIAKDLQLDFNFTTTNKLSYHRTGAEDLHLQAYWHIPIELQDEAGDLAATVIPYLACGMWFPTGDKSDPKKLFSVPTGNDGFYVLTAEFSIGFDFPVIPQNGQTLQFDIGGGLAATVDSKTRHNMRVPSTNPIRVYDEVTQDPNYVTDFQSGFYPWMTTVRQRPGLTWYLNAALKAENFLDGLSVYADYIYTQHLKDSMTLKEPDETRKNSFKGGFGRFKRQTTWKNQQVDFGLDYRIAPALSMGGAIQGHISGERVFRTTTLLGSVTFTF